ncbi:MAG: hypothetical protein LBC37_00275 [Zoogloeaceae bacterium]|jgi:uncharacterized coiled-coil protein SlyX|nr:hypothetical protein [Zoogloeaceae bacterium]
MASPLEPLRCALLFALFALWASPTLAQPDPPPRVQGEFSCCTDANGQRSCGEILPRQCVGRAYTIYSRSGLRIRNVAPPKTETEKTEAAVEIQRLEKEREIAAEQQRRRLAIMSTYNNMKEIDDRQRQDEANLRKDVGETRQRIADSQKHLQELQDKVMALQTDKDGKKKKNPPPLPHDLEEGIRNVEMDIKYQNELIKIKESELARISAKYDRDRREYRELVGER